MSQNGPVVRHIVDWVEALAPLETPILGMMPKCVEWKAVRSHPIRARIKGALWIPVWRWLPEWVPGKAQIVNALHVGRFTDLDDRVCVRYESRTPPNQAKMTWGHARIGATDD